MDDIEEPKQLKTGRKINLSFHTRPDIAFAVSIASEFMHDPYEEHLEVVYWIRTSKGTVF